MQKICSIFLYFLFSRVDNPSGLAPRSGQGRRISFGDDLPLPSQETFNEIHNEDDLHVDDLPNRKSNLKKVLCNSTQPKQKYFLFLRFDQKVMQATGVASVRTRMTRVRSWRQSQPSLSSGSSSLTSSSALGTPSLTSSRASTSSFSSVRTLEMTA